MAVTPNDPLVVDAAAKTGLPTPVVAAQVNMESGGNARAVSPAGAQGEFQFMPGTFAAQGTGGSPFNPQDEERAYVKYMSGLLKQFHGNVRNALAAYNAGPGNIGAGMGYADKILGASGHSAGLSAAGAPGARSVTYQIPGASFPTQIGGGVNTKAAMLAVLEAQAKKPIDTSGKVHAPNVLKDYVGAIRSGQFNTQPVSSADTTRGSTGQTQGSLRTTGLAGITGRGSNINPLEDPNWNIGRTDMGVDAGARPGTPIKAINDSVVKEIVPNWYSGQPLVLMQLTSGPDAGKYWYVSEQIAQIPHVGQMIRRGDTVAVFAPQGTGIEIGWGDPHSSGRTLAQAQGNTGDASHGNSPAGLDFLHHVLGH